MLHSPLWTSPPEDKRIITQRKQMNTGKTRHRFQLCSDAFLKSSAHWILGNYLITQCCVAKAEVLSVWKKKTMRASSANHLWIRISSFGNCISMVQCPKTVLNKKAAVLHQWKRVFRSYLEKSFELNFRAVFKVLLNLLLIRNVQIDGIDPLQQHRFLPRTQTANTWAGKEAVQERNNLTL